MKLTYIYHSGIALEGDGFTIIIDYYKDSSDISTKGIVHSCLLKRPGKLYVLSTHFHPDHFNPEILEWRRERPDIVYIFSKDILKHRSARAEDALYLRKSDVYKDELLSVRAFGSTDAGVSFLIEVENCQFFHAGDLNNWHWNEESTLAEIKKAEGDYGKELHMLADYTDHVHVAMFPIDPRLGRDYRKGAEQFIDCIKTDIFVPIHFGDAYECAAAFQSLAARRGTLCIPWTYRGESIEV